jgi:hypothetical protein
MVSRRGRKNSREAELERELEALRAAKLENKESEAAVTDETAAMTLDIDEKQDDSSTSERTHAREVSS